MKSKFHFKSRLSMSLLLSTVLLFSQCQKDADQELTPVVESLPENTISATASTSVSQIALNTTSARSDGGYAYTLKQNLGTTGDSGSQPTISTVKIYENGVELNPAHSSHADIRSKGNGRFSHWGSVLYFSTSDNSDPRTNGRKYTYSVGGSASVSSPAPAPAPTPTPTPTPVPTTGIIGYANVDGQTTGGQGGQTVTVSTLSALKSAVASSSPMIIQVSGTITGTGYVTVNSNKTILGLSGSSMQGVGLYIYGKSNIIIKNMTIRNVLTYTNIIIKENAHHIWVDHCTLSSKRLANDWTTYDGLLDVTRGSNYVTISWNKFSDSHIPVLIGGGDATTTDKGKLKVTMHNNYFYNVSERQPRIRFGTVHVFNNYIKASSGYGIGVAMGGIVRTDNNYFENAKVPISTSLGSEPGYVSGANTNVYQNSGANKITTAASTWVPTYSYQSALIPAANVPSVVTSGAGAK